MSICRDCHDLLEQLILLVEFDRDARSLYRLPRWCYWALVQFFMRDDVNEAVIKAVYRARGLKPCRLVSFYPDIILSHKIQDFWTSIVEVADRGVELDHAIPYYVSVEERSVVAL